jgi:DNA damage-binding protein 1
MDKELVAECGHHGHTLVLYMESRGDFIAIGDLMKSISLLNYKALDGSLEEIAKDLNSNWMTAIDILDDDHYIGSETDFNLFCVQRQSGATTDEERSRLECVGEFHLGEFVNRFRHGSLVMQPPPASTTSTTTTTATTPSSAMAATSSQESITWLHAPPRPLLFGTVSGMIGCILPLDMNQYTFFQRLTMALNKVIQGIGNFTHKDWRMYESKRHVSEPKNFIDGDLIERFLDLSRERMQMAVDALNADGTMDGLPPYSVDDVLATVEDMAQRH